MINKHPFPSRWEEREDRNLLSPLKWDRKYPEGELPLGLKLRAELSDGSKERYPTLLEWGTSFVEGNFSMDLVVGGDLGMIQAHYIYYTLYFYYYTISSTSDYGAFDPGVRRFPYIKNLSPLQPWS